MRARFSSRALLLVAAALLAGIFTGVAKAAPILDAHDTVFNGSIPYGPAVNTGEEQSAQVFTAINSGTLDHISVQVCSCGASSDLHVRLTAGLGGTTLAQTTLLGAVPGSYGWLDVTLPGSIAITAGTTYAIELSDPNNGFGRWATHYIGPVQQAYFYWTFSGGFIPWGGQNGDYEVWLQGSDSTPPSLTVSHVADGQNGWNVTSPVSVTVDASDADSGLAGAATCTVDGSPASLPLSVSGEGTHAVDCSVTDNAGNTATASDTVKIDTIAPTIDVSHVADGENGWNVTSPVTVTVTASEGTATCDGSTSVSGEGTHVLTCTTSDEAGNTATASDTVKIDTIAPTIDVSHVADGQNGWNVTSPVALSVTASEGSPTCTGGTSVSGEGTHLVTCTTSDDAGNSASASDTVKIDTISPTVTYTGNAGTYAIGDTVHITCAAADAGGSGVDSSTCADVNGTAASFGPGAHTFSADATDLAGNAGHGSVTFTVTVSPAALCALTKGWSTNAGIANALCRQLGVGNNGSNRPSVDQYETLLAAQSGKAFTAAQAALLRAYAETLR